jgi:hypothetical protein
MSTWIRFAEGATAWPLSLEGRDDANRAQAEEINRIIGERWQSIAVALSPINTGPDRAALMILIVRFVVAVMAWQPDLDPTDEDCARLNRTITRLLISWADEVEIKRGDKV